jgi:hypothetical protein
MKTAFEHILCGLLIVMGVYMLVAERTQEPDQTWISYGGQHLYLNAANPDGSATQSCLDCPETRLSSFTPSLLDSLRFRKPGPLLAWPDFAWPSGVGSRRSMP